MEKKRTSNWGTNESKSNALDSRECREVQRIRKSNVFTKQWAGEDQKKWKRKKNIFFMNNFKGGGRLEVLYICLLFLIFFLGWLRERVIKNWKIITHSTNYGTDKIKKRNSFNRSWHVVFGNSKRNVCIMHAAQCEQNFKTFKQVIMIKSLLIHFFIGGNAFRRVGS